MKKYILYGLWGFFYILCLVLGYTVPAETAGAQNTALIVLSVAFFVPPVILLVDAHRTQDKKGLAVLRTVSLLSLGLTFGALLLNVLSALWSQAVGDFLHQVLIFVSVPMTVSGSWLLSLFLWACLLFASIPGKAK